MIQGSPINNMSDEEVLRLSIDNPNFFEVLVNRHQKAFLRKAKSILLNNEDVSDVVQETFVRVYISAGKFKPVKGATFLSWAYKILTNQCLTQYKKSKLRLARNVNLEDEVFEMIGDKSVEDSFEQKLDKDYVLSMISMLPLKMKVIAHAMLEGSSISEIAQKENVSENVVRTRMHRLKQAFKKILSS